MSNTRFRSSTNSPAKGRNAPRLWVEGQQQPRFDLRGYSRVSLLLSRRMARPLLLGTAQLLHGGAERMADNTLGPRFARASRVGRAMPSRDTLAQGLDAMASFMTVAADLAVPPPEMPAFPEPLETPQLTNRRARRTSAQETSGETPVVDAHEPVMQVMPPTDAAPAEPVPARDPATPDDTGPDLDAPTLAAIRALIEETRDVRPTRPAAPHRRKAPPPPEPVSGRVLLTHGVPLAPPEPPLPTFAQILSARALRLAAGLVAGAFTLLTLPVGLVQAVVTHLQGNDLRTWS